MATTTGTTVVPIHSWEMPAGPPHEAHAFVQWKGTDVCMDFHCACDASIHVDARCAYTVRCPYCGVVWELGTYLPAREAENQTEAHVSPPKDDE